MVKFGERMVAMQHLGWEAHYINYDDLKVTIGKLDACSTDAEIKAVSDQFCDELTKAFKRVDSFVLAETKSLRSAFNSSDAASLRKVHSSVRALRGFVGTNVIASTKIAKKHDKHVPPALSKRLVIGNMIRGSQAFSQLIAFSAEVDAKSPEAAKEASTEEEKGLRSLPDWLLSGASGDQEGSETSGVESMHGQFSYPKFFSVYLEDWRVRPGNQPSGQRKPTGEALLSKGDKVAEQASPIADDWDVDFGADGFGELTTEKRIMLAFVIFIKLCLVLGALYFFICTLSFMATGFRLVAGRQAGQVFQNSEVFNNPVAGMLVGVLVTVLVQSSSTSTSIFITMVAADLLTVKQAISLIMGANIGTSVTSTIVALGQSGNRNEFRRAFAAATVHDMFNFLNVLVLLPLEIITGYLYSLSKAIVDSTPGLQPGEKPPDILKKLTKPFTSKIIGIDKKLITKIAEGTVDSDDDSVPMIEHIFGDKSYNENGKDDVLIGWIVLIISLAILCICLYTIVYLLKSILKGHIALWLHKGVNGQVPDIKCGETITIPMGWASGYLAMAVGLGLTICVQSSSITTSALTPLVGIGVITIERMYPVVLGANIGTCITGVLAALAASSSKLALTLQVAYAHLFFNVTGIFIWYGIWPMRQFPVRAAKFMGNTTAEYRWFALAYLAFAFLIIPAIFMGIAFGGPGAIIPVVVLCVLAGLFVAIVNTMQFRCPERLPAKLRDWLWLPEPLRSLRPYDRYIFAPLGAQLGKCCKCCKQDDAVPLKDLKGQAKVQAASTDELAKAAERMA